METHKLTPTDFSTPDPKTAAIGIAAGFPLNTVAEDNDRLVFSLAGAPADFQLRIARGDITVNARDIAASWESVMGIVSAYKRRKAGR